MRGPVLAACGAVALLLGGCQADPASSQARPATSAATVAAVATVPSGGATTVSTPAVPASGVAFRCPATGTRLTFGNGGYLEFQGADPADPVVCLARNANGQQQRRLYNFWTLPLDDDSALRQGFGALWPAVPGKTAAYTFIGRTADNNTFRYSERWRVVGAEILQIGGSPRATMVLERVQEGMLGNNFLGTDTYWFDVQTGSFLKRQVSVTRGRAGVSSFEATSIIAPTGT